MFGYLVDSLVVHPSNAGANSRAGTLNRQLLRRRQMKVSLEWLLAVVKYVTTLYPAAMHSAARHLSFFSGFICFDHASNSANFASARPLEIAGRALETHS